MRIQNIDNLSSMLLATGFAESVGKRVLQKVCFKPVDFVLTERLVKGRDLLTCTIYFEGKGEEYICVYYDAALFKAIEVPELTINGIHLRELDKSMATIDWIFPAVPEKFDLKDEASWQQELLIEKVVTELFRLSATDDGRYYADSLKARYWRDNPFVPVNMPVLCSKFEVSQRFYFFDGQGISTDEAFRFLLNRWLEKKLYARKKSTGDTANAEDAGSVKNDKSLLQKKRKNSNIKLTR